MIQTIKFKKLSEDATIPTRGSQFAAGYDLSSSGIFVIPPRGRCLVKTDIVLEIPNGYYGRIAPRSGLALKHGLDVGAGVIDSDYRGAIGVVLFNHTDDPYFITKGNKIAQIIIIPIITPELEEVVEVTDTKRGEGGFGSTDVSVKIE